MYYGSAALGLTIPHHKKSNVTCSSRTLVIGASWYVKVGVENGGEGGGGGDGDVAPNEIGITWSWNESQNLCLGMRPAFVWLEWGKLHRRIQSLQQIPSEYVKQVSLGYTLASFQLQWSYATIMEK
jgi:hypothetical protein